VGTNYTSLLNRLFLNAGTYNLDSATCVIQSIKCSKSAGNNNIIIITIVYYQKRFEPESLKKAVILIMCPHARPVHKLYITL